MSDGPSSPPAPPDWVGPDEDDPDWDDEEGLMLVGSYAIVGVTWVDGPGGPVIGRGQYHGRVVHAGPRGITVLCEGAFAGTEMRLPPIPGLLEPADGGSIYRLSSTGEVVEEPDFVGSMTITSPPKQ